MSRTLLRTGNKMVPGQEKHEQTETSRYIAHGMINWDRKTLFLVRKSF